MQPENSQPQLGPERASVEHLQNAERLPKLPTPEKGGIETGAEREEQVAESRAAIVDIPTTIASLPTTTIPSPVVDDSGTSSTPLVADDSDLIEKEWIDRAKKIIQETHDDPAKREQQVSALQKDYLHKRYGKELGAA